MLNTLKDAFMDQGFHKKLVQDVALAVVVATVSAVAQQGAKVVVAEVKKKMDEKAADAAVQTVTE